MHVTCQKAAWEAGIIQKPHNKSAKQKHRDCAAHILNFLKSTKICAVRYYTAQNPRFGTKTKQNNRFQRSGHPAVGLIRPSSWSLRHHVFRDKSSPVNCRAKKVQYINCELVFYFSNQLWQYRTFRVVSSSITYSHLIWESSPSEYLRV